MEVVPPAATKTERSTCATDAAVAEHRSPPTVAGIVTFTCDMAPPSTHVVGSCRHAAFAQTSLGAQ